MGNLNSKLEILFRQYLIRKEKEKNTVTPYNYSHCGSSWMNDEDNYDGVIYFYEWSDINRAPTLFYKIGAFDAFLRRSSIFMPPYQKEVIKQLDRAYVTCRKGTHELLIRGSRPLLVDAVGDDKAPCVDLKTATEAVLNTPPPPPTYPAYGGFQNRRPPMYDDGTCQWYG